MLRSLGYSVVLVSPFEERVEERLLATSDVASIVGGLVEAATGLSARRLVEEALEIVARLLARRVGLVALLLDDVFQAVGVDRAEALVKRLLNLIEYPPGDYEKIVVLVGSSEGVSRERLRRHDWARLTMIWNLSRSGFEELYSKLPGEKPPVDNAWKWTGGNPRMLARLYEEKWRTEVVVRRLAAERGSIGSPRGGESCSKCSSRTPTLPSRITGRSRGS